jgi:hypothetical protein
MHETLRDLIPKPTVLRAEHVILHEPHELVTQFAGPEG